VAGVEFVVLQGFMRSATPRSLSEWITRSLVETWYEVGFFVHAGSETALPKVNPTGAFCVAAITSASSTGRSWQKLSWNLSCLIQT
jgi:hypothetical protein